MPHLALPLAEISGAKRDARDPAEFVEERRTDEFSVEDKTSEEVGAEHSQAVQRCQILYKFRKIIPYK